MKRLHRFEMRRQKAFEMNFQQRQENTENKRLLVGWRPSASGTSLRFEIPVGWRKSGIFPFFPDFVALELPKALRIQARRRLFPVSSQSDLKPKNRELSNPNRELDWFAKVSAFTPRLDGSNGSACREVQPRLTGRFICDPHPRVYPPVPCRSRAPQPDHCEPLYRRPERKRDRPPQETVEHSVQSIIPRGPRCASF